MIYVFITPPPSPLPNPTTPTNITMHLAEIEEEE